jgi:hypothetical protein
VPAVNVQQAFSFNQLYHNILAQTHQYRAFFVYLQVELKERNNGGF